MADNLAGFAALDAQIARLRALGGDFVKRAAPKVAEAAEAAVRERLALGRSPSGRFWEPTRENRRPLRRAGRTLSVRALGTVILFKLEGHEALHDTGRARGKITRRMLPTRRLSAELVTAIRRVLGDQFQAVMRGDDDDD